MKNEKLFEHIKELIETSPTASHKMLEIVMSDVKLYEAIVCDPEYFHRVYLRVKREQRYIGSLSFDVPRIPENIEHFATFSEEEVHMIYNFLLTCFQNHIHENRYYDSNATTYRRMFNNLFGCINKDIPKFNDLYKFVADTDYKICRNDNYESIVYTVEHGMCKRLSVGQLIFNPRISEEQFKYLLKNYEKLFTPLTGSFSAGEDSRDEAEHVTDLHLEKYLYAASANLPMYVEDYAIINYIFNECSKEIVAQYLQECVIPNRRGGWGNQIDKVIYGLFYRRPDVLELCGNDDRMKSWVMGADQLNIDIMYKFMCHDVRNNISDWIVTRLNTKNSKITIDKDATDEEIVKYIKRFGRKTSYIYILPGAEVDDIAHILKLCIDNDVKLSKASSCFDTYNMGTEKSMKLLETLNELVDSYGCNSRVIIEWAQSFKNVAGIVESKIEGDDLRNRYRGYLLSVL